MHSVSGFGKWFSPTCHCILDSVMSIADWVGKSSRYFAWEKNLLLLSITLPRQNPLMSLGFQKNDVRGQKSSWSHTSPRLGPDTIAVYFWNYGDLQNSPCLPIIFCSPQARLFFRPRQKNSRTKKLKEKTQNSIKKLKDSANVGVIYSKNQGKWSKNKEETTKIPKSRT